MKTGIHPDYNKSATITCIGCGKVHTIGSTRGDMQVEICSNCHPFYTGEEKFVDTLGRVEKFQQKKETAEKIKKEVSLKEQEKKQKEEKTKTKPKTLKEMMAQARKEMKRVEESK